MDGNRHRVALTEKDFFALAGGQVISCDLGDNGKLEICLSDIGFDRTLNGILSAAFDAPRDEAERKKFSNKPPGDVGVILCVPVMPEQRHAIDEYLRENSWAKIKKCYACGCDIWRDTRWAPTPPPGVELIEVCQPCGMHRIEQGEGETVIPGDFMSVKQLCDMWDMDPDEAKQFIADYRKELKTKNEVMKARREFDRDVSGGDKKS